MHIHPLFNKGIIVDYQNYILEIRYNQVIQDCGVVVNFFKKRLLDK